MQCRGLLCCYGVIRPIADFLSIKYLVILPYAADDRNTELTLIMTLQKSGSVCDAIFVWIYVDDLQVLIIYCLLAKTYL